MKMTGLFYVNGGSTIECSANPRTHQKVCLAAATMLVVSRQKKAAQNMGQAHSSLNRSQPIIRKSKLAMLHYLQSFTVQRKPGGKQIDQ